MANQWWQIPDKKQYINSLISYYEFSAKENEGYIYIVKSDIYFKIGRATHIYKRLSSYNTHNPNGVEVIIYKKVKDCVLLESILHSFLCFMRYKNEWFLLDDYMLDLTKTLIEQINVKTI